MGIQPGARFPARSTDALPATLYGHFTQAIYRNRPTRNPRVLSYMTSYDVASTNHQSLAGGGGGTNTSSVHSSPAASPGHGAFPYNNGIVNGTGPGGGGGGGGGRGGLHAKPVAAAVQSVGAIGAIGAIGGQISRPSTAPLPMVRRCRLDLRNPC